MKLKVNTLKGLLSTSCTLSIKLTVFALFVCLSAPIMAQTAEPDVIKEADNLFEEEEYTKAYKLYAQLVSNHPTDPLYNYRLGVCMIYSEPDKKKSFSYLNKAYQNRANLPKDVTFFYGKAYHINYLFDEAIRYYNEFKKEAPASMQKKLQVDREIKACGNGKRLLSTITDLEILTKKQLNTADYFRAYDLSSIGGKLLVKPEDFRTGYDKKKKDKSIIYYPKTVDKVFFSSYGDNNNNGKDIYYKERLPNGQFGESRIIDGINTEFDEDYPFLHPNGKTLYFASKGHNSMGGYDIFMSTFNESTQSWSTPKNLEFPINSPDDDYLYVTDSSEKVAYFSTSRYSQPGKIDVLKIKTERKPIDFIVMKGTVTKESIKQSVKSKITIKNISNEQLVGTFEAEDNGNFTMQLPNGAKLLYTVETPGLRTQSQGVILPLATVGKPFKQTITYEDGVLKIVNNFEEPPSDDSYLQYLKLIEEKSKLNPNEGQNKLSTDVAANETIANNAGNNPDAVKTTNPTIDPVKNNTNPKNTNGNKITDNKTKTEGINNKAIIDIAKQDAFESEGEAKQLNQDSKDAIELGNAKKIEAETKLKDAETALTNAQAITDEAKKTEETAKAIEQKKEAENDLAVANKILELGKTLEKDAANKSKEAELNKKYAAELENISTAKNNTPEAKQRLADLQKEIADISSQKNESENTYSTLKNDVSEKEKELAIATEKTNGLNKEYTEISDDVAKTETELNNAKKKKEKAEINTRLTDLKTEQQKLETALNQSKSDESRITQELNTLKNELALADRIKNENIAKVEETKNIENTANPTDKTNAVAANKNASEKLNEKYINKIYVTDPNNKDNITDVNKQLIAYNKEIDAQIAKDKTDLAKAKSPEEKKRLSSDIKNLEVSKKQNQQSIANNNTRIADLNKQIAAGANTQNANENLKTISTDNPNQALTQLKDIKNALTQADNQVFNYNNYTNTNVQTKKIEADGQINEVYALQNKLKETIAKSEETIQNASVSMPKNSENPDALLKQSDDLYAKAQALRTEAKDKQGPEKEKLLNDALDLEKQAEVKQIEASEAGNKIAIGKNDVNKENIATLLATNKADENTVNQVKALMESAEQELRQAKAIREEANALNNNAAKIGNLGNAEEKEAVVLNKQNEALELLKKANPDVALKPYKDLNTVNITNEAVLKTEIAKINEEVKQLVNAKSTAYKTLSDANEEELKDLSTAAQNNNTIANTPALKSQYTVITKNLSDLAALKAKTEQSSNETEKLVNLSNLVKKQNETLIAINKLNADAESKTLAAADTKTKTAETKTENAANNDTKNVAANNPDNTKVNETKTNETKTENANNADNNANNAANSTVAKNNIPVEQANTSFTVDLSYENHKDTSLNQINNYFVYNNFELRNTQANTLKNNSLDALKSLEAENNQLNESIKNASTENNSTAPNITNEDIKSKIDGLTSASDNMSQEASNIRTEANTKTGEEKDALLEQAKAMEEKAFSKKVEAATLTQQYNDANYNANSNAINDMLVTLNSSNPELAASLKQKADELEVKKRQAKNIREEANALSNNSARLGAIGNAEEEEASILMKQNELISELKKSVPDYTVKEPNYNNLNGTKEIPADLKQKQNEIANRQQSELTNLTNAFSLEFETNKNLIPKTLTPDQTKLKNNVFGLNTESKNLLIKSTKTNNPNEKLKLLSLAAKTGHAAATQLNILINKQAVPSVAGINNNVKITAPENTTAKTNVTANNTVKNNTKANETKDNVAVNNTKTNETKNNTTANTAKTKTNETKDNLADNKTDNKTKNITKTKTKEDTKVKTTEASNVNETKSNVAESTAGTKVLARIEGLEVLNKDAYTDAKPIPINAKMPDGLIFRVQIGAFKTQISNNSFRGLTPVNGETTANGYTRYTAGNFNKIENASAVKGDLNKNGYPDAFVVAFFNGKRITLNEAMAILGNEGKTVNTNAPLTAGISDNVNPNGSGANLAPENILVTKELEKTKNLLYTVQIGVYSRIINKARLNNLSPIYTEQLPNGLFRYTAGIYSNAEKLISDKNRVIDLGIKDAFVSAYIDGKKLPFNEAKAKKEADPNILFEAENPIVFPAVSTANAPANTPAVTPVVTTSPTVAPFTNNVKTKPAATPENGIKETEEGITFKVQVGAYSKQVPADVATKYNAIKNWPIENKMINGLYLYNVGNFNDAKFAKQLKEEVVALGITDAFIAVYKDGVKLFGADAATYLNR